MPNTRRRRFSVQNDIAKRNPNKVQRGIQCSQPDPDTEMKTDNSVTSKSTKTKYKTCMNSSKDTNLSEVIADSNSVTSTLTVEKAFTLKVDKDVTACSSNIYLLNIQTMSNNKASANRSKESIITQMETQVKTNDRVQPNRDRTPWRRDKHPREHRVKVRSPKRRGSMYVNNCNEGNIQTRGTIPIDGDNNNIEPCVTETVEIAGDHDRSNNNSIDYMCRICHSGEGLSVELGALISACLCRGTVGRVHVKCLERWLTESGKSRCELCGTRYLTKRVHKYGVPRALVMWILSQNAKQLMVDSLGIMLMSPLAVLAAWLSGRTLAGLMTQDSHMTPWPLASTFVLACMTLVSIRPDYSCYKATFIEVCYYCWIVSAATRHAIGWWIWYRSQYEVRLQFQDDES